MKVTLNIHFLLFEYNVKYLLDVSSHDKIVSGAFRYTLLKSEQSTW